MGSEELPMKIAPDSYLLFLRAARGITKTEPGWGFECWNGNDLLELFDISLFIIFETTFLCPPSKKEGQMALHMSVGRYVGRYVGMSGALNLVQLISPERFAPEASNLEGR